jgi:hypothetical protein
VSQVLAAEGAALVSLADELGSPASTTLQQITRDAEQRLQEWDAEDQREEELEAKYWWLGLVDLAVSLAVGHDPLTDLQIRGLNAQGQPRSIAEPVPR